VSNRGEQKGTKKAHRVKTAEKKSKKNQIFGLGILQISATTGFQGRQSTNLLEVMLGRVSKRKFKYIKGTRPLAKADSIMEYTIALALAPRVQKENNQFLRLYV